jgi:hypothetical protein
MRFSWFAYAFFFSLISNTFANEVGTCDADENGVCKNDVKIPSAATQSQSEITPSAKIAKGSNEQGAPPKASLKDCQDRYPQCVEFAERGECENNPGWMIISCPISCNACELRDPRRRCDRDFLNITHQPGFLPGEMNEMFQSIVPLFREMYDVEVLSEDPWIILFHNFVADTEIEGFLTSVENSWERSTDSGQVNELGEVGRQVSTSRTSSNAWCRHDCENNEHVQEVIRKIEQVTRLPYENSESFQILQYLSGQFYRVHHDMAP